MFELFYFDRNLDEIVIDNPFLFTMPEFKRLWSRINAIKGDSVGKLKLQNKREFMYIYFMEGLSKNNPFRLLPRDARHLEAIKSSELPAGFQPDELVVKCCALYAKYVVEYTPTLKFLVQLEQMIMQVGRQVTIIKDQNEALLKSLEGGELVQTKDGVAVNSVDSIVIIQANINRCFDLLKSVATMQVQKKELEKKIKEEEEAVLNITGGRKIGNRENPIRL